MELTIHVDGSSTGKLIGASPFPRHWIYDTDGKLIEKSGIIEFKSWYRNAFGKHSPWGDEESPAFATAVVVLTLNRFFTPVQVAEFPPFAPKSLRLYTALKMKARADVAGNGRRDDALAS